MIIQILSNLFEEGYLPRESYTSLSPFFAGANVAFRKKALEQIGEALKEQGLSLEEMITSSREIRGQILKEEYDLEADEE